MSEQQLSLLDWRPPAEILPFPLHRSHGLTACVAREIVNLDTPKRTGRLNTMRSQVRRRLTPFIGADRADEVADAYILMVRTHFNYHPLPKQITKPGLILPLPWHRDPVSLSGNGGGEAIALVPRAKPLAGLGGAHNLENVTARASEGSAA